jgi:hypothetical protein
MNTEQTHHSDRFQLGRKANPQSIRRAAVNFNKLLEATPLSQAERYAESLIHGKGHVDRWAELQADGSVPSDVEYDRIPRGRVSYDAVRDQFLVLRDRCIPMKAIRQVISTLHLPKDKVVVAGDPHYRCPRCMEKGTE